MRRIRLYTRKIGKISHPNENVETTDSDDIFFEDPKEKSCCSTPIFSVDEGYRVCHNCGETYSQIFDDSPRRTYNQQEKKNRIINEIVYNPIGPRTIIRGNKDAHGRIINSKNASFFRKLGKINKSIFSSFERNLYTAIPIFDRLQERLSIPDNIRKDAMRIYTYAVKEKMTLGRSIESLISAAVFSAIRISGTPLTMEEILEITGVPKKKCVKDYGLIRLRILPQLNFKVKHLTPDRYIDRFTEDLKLPMQCRNFAIRLLLRAINKGYNTSGKDPKGIAAAVIYAASQMCGEIRTQKEVCSITQVTQVTLRNRKREIASCINISW